MNLENIEQNPPEQEPPNGNPSSIPSNVLNSKRDEDIYYFSQETTE